MRVQESTPTRCRITRRILPVNDVCGDDAPAFDVSSAVTADSEVADEILDAARQSGCDHLFIVGRRRSPTGKVLFGDIAQQVIFNFDGHVTITMD